MKSRVAGSYLSPASGKASERIAAYGRGRVCAAPGCTTLLSAYNPGSCCSLHAAFCQAPVCKRST
jgi:hypothetical protein